MNEIGFAFLGMIIFGLIINLLNNLLIPLNPPLPKGDIENSNVVKTGTPYHPDKSGAMGQAVLIFKHLTDVFRHDKILLMRLTKRRRENLARFCFNLSQIVFAMFIAGRILSPEKITLLNFSIGIALFLVFLLLGYLTDEGEE